MEDAMVVDEPVPAPAPVAPAEQAPPVPAPPVVASPPEAILEVKSAMVVETNGSAPEEPPAAPAPAPEPVEANGTSHADAAPAPVENGSEEVREEQSEEIKGKEDAPLSPKPEAAPKLVKRESMGSSHMKNHKVINEVDLNNIIPDAGLTGRRTTRTSVKPPEPPAPPRPPPPVEVPQSPKEPSGKDTPRSPIMLPPKKAALLAQPKEAKAPPATVIMTPDGEQDVLLGCAKCRYLRGGCGKCREKPTLMRKKLRWQPESAHSQDEIPQAPKYYPTAEEFKDPLAYLAAKREEMQKAGMAIIVPPKGWSPPFALDHGTDGQSTESFRFITKKQYTSKLIKRAAGSRPTDDIGGASRYDRPPQGAQGEAAATTAAAAAAAAEADESANLAAMLMGFSNGGPDTPPNEGDEKKEGDDDPFGFELARTHTLRSFKSYADWFKRTHFEGCGKGRAEAAARAVEAAGGKRRKDYDYGVDEPLIEEVEGEFWRIVEDPDCDMEVLYGQDLESGYHGSGFPLPPHRSVIGTPAVVSKKKNGEAKPLPKSSRKAKMTPAQLKARARLEEEYARHPWNVNNMPVHKHSLLRHIVGNELIPGVMVPWLYVGACMSAFCWHIEDHALYSVNYLHMGASKVWYAIPPSHSKAFEDFMREELPDLFEASPDLLYQLITMMSPSKLREKGIPVVRGVQDEGQFTITYANAFHAGFNVGFNVAEAVNFAPADWVPFGDDAVVKYQRDNRAVTISHDQLLIKVTEKGNEGSTDVRADAVKLCRESLRARVAKEARLRASVEEHAKGGFVRMKKGSRGGSRDGRRMYTDTEDVDCCKCSCDLYLSSVVCPCEPEVASCLEHAQFLCECRPDRRKVLYRYTLDELNDVVNGVAKPKSVKAAKAPHAPSPRPAGQAEGVPAAEGMPVKKKKSGKHVIKEDENGYPLEPVPPVIALGPISATGKGIVTGRLPGKKPPGEQPTATEAAVARERAMEAEMDDDEDEDEHPTFAEDDAEEQEDEEAEALKAEAEQEKSAGAGGSFVDHVPRPPLKKRRYEASYDAAPAAEAAAPDAAKECGHCGATSSPNWRGGPDGCPVLCNACGVHFAKKGTLEGRSRGEKEPSPAAGEAGGDGAAGGGAGGEVKEEEAMEEAGGAGGEAADAPGAMEVDEAPPAAPPAALADELQKVQAAAAQAMATLMAQYAEQAAAPPQVQAEVPAAAAAAAAAGGIPMEGFQYSVPVPAAPPGGIPGGGAGEFPAP